jgi:hypothetical protein
MVLGVDENSMVMKKKDKAGFWKCPYHSTRACLEIINRTANKYDKTLNKNFFENSAAGNS